jgi:hypothetical protein
MKLRLLVSIALFGLVLFLSFRAVRLLRPRDPINPENYARIKVGMTEAEVRAIFGGQEGVPPPCGSGQPPGTYTLSWFGDEGSIVVLFQLQTDAAGLDCVLVTGRGLPGLWTRRSPSPAPSRPMRWRSRGRPPRPPSSCETRSERSSCPGVRNSGQSVLCRSWRLHPGHG